MRTTDGFFSSGNATRVIQEFAIPASLAAATGMLGLGRGRAYVVIAFAGAGILAIASIFLFPALGQLIGAANPRVHAGWGFLAIAAAALALILMLSPQVPAGARVMFGVVGAIGLLAGAAVTTLIFVEAARGATYDALQWLADIASPLFIAVLGTVLMVALAGAATALVREKALTN